MNTIPFPTSPRQYQSKSVESASVIPCEGQLFALPHRGAAQAAPLLYLYSNNSIENVPESTLNLLISAFTKVLSPYRKRQAETLYKNVARLISLAPSPGHVGFLTLTFKDNVTCDKEAYRRFRSFNSNFLAPSDEFGEWVCVKERQGRGAWHYHLLLILSYDIRTGFDFSGIDRGDYSSASPHLKRMWSKLRMALPKYGFGRHELLPIKSNGEGMARYMGKYISKGCAMLDPHKNSGVRLISYSRNWSKNSVKFQWFTPGSRKWRKKLDLFAASHGCEDMYDLTCKLGPGWAYKYVPEIVSLPDPDETQDYDNLVASVRSHMPRYDAFAPFRDHMESHMKDRRWDMGKVQSYLDMVSEIFNSSMEGSKT